MSYQTTNLTLPGNIADADLPSDLTTLDPFPAYATPLALDIEGGGSVELQRVNSSGAWETFETVFDVKSQVFVANSPAIRVAPVSSASYQVSWGKRC